MNNNNLSSQTDAAVCGTSKRYRRYLQKVFQHPHGGVDALGILLVGLVQPAKVLYQKLQALEQVWEKTTLVNTAATFCRCTYKVEGLATVTR